MDIEFKSARELYMKVIPALNTKRRILNKKGIHLLHIYEIEALILADIETFNKIYKTKMKSVMVTKILV